MTSPNRVGTLALLGSGEFTPNLLEIDKYLLSKVENPKVVIIPTAASQETDYPKWIKRGVTHFKKLGIKAEGLRLVTRDDSHDPEFVKKLSDFNFFYFSGGNPGHLLEVLKGSPVWNVIYENYQKGAVLAGSSAGAMVMGAKVWSKIFNFVKNGKVEPWEEGLGIVEFGILPHHDRLRNEFNEKQIKLINNNLPKDVKILGIDEDTAYIKEDNEWKTMGMGTTSFLPS